MNSNNFKNKGEQLGSPLNFLKGNSEMIEIAEKEDINRIDGELIELRRKVQELDNEIKELKGTREALQKLVSSLSGNYTAY